MLLQTRGPEIKPGDYTTTRAQDTPTERADCERVLRLNGCRSFRYERTSDGRLVAHGYLTEGLVFHG